MELSDKELLKAYQGFRAEASACIIEDIIALVFMIAAFFLSRNRWGSVLLIFFTAYVFFLFIRIYKVYYPAVISFVEISNHTFNTKVLQIKSICEDDSWTGRWENKISKQFPAQLHINKYILKCVDAQGRNLCLRSVMGRKTYNALSNALLDDVPINRTIIYGKLSRVIIKYADKDDLSFILNHYKY